MQTIGATAETQVPCRGRKVQNRPGATGRGQTRDRGTREETRVSPGHTASKAHRAAKTDTTRAAEISRSAKADGPIARSTAAESNGRQGERGHGAREGRGKRASQCKGRGQNQSARCKLESVVLHRSISSRLSVLSLLCACVLTEQNLQREKARIKALTQKKSPAAATSTATKTPPASAKLQATAAGYLCAQSRANAYVCDFVSHCQVNRVCSQPFSSRFERTDHREDQDQNPGRAT